MRTHIHTVLLHNICIAHFFFQLNGYWLSLTFSNINSLLCTLYFCPSYLTSVSLHIVKSICHILFLNLVHRNLAGFPVLFGGNLHDAGLFSN